MGTVAILAQAILAQASASNFVRESKRLLSSSHGEGDEGDEACEQGGEGQGDAEGRDLRGDRVQLRREEAGREGGVREPQLAHPWAAEGGGQVRDPRSDDDQAAEEAGDQGREADGLRQAGDREGEARAYDREVLHGEGAQG